MNHPFSMGDSFTKEGVSERTYTRHITKTPTVFTSRTFPVAGQKASEAAFTDSTEEKESLTINSTLCYLPGLDGGSNFRELDVHNIAKRVLSVVSNSNNSGLSSSVLRNIAK